MNATDVIRNFHKIYIAVSLFSDKAKHISIRDTRITGFHKLYRIEVFFILMSNIFSSFETLKQILQDLLRVSVPLPGNFCEQRVLLLLKNLSNMNPNFHTILPDWFHK